MDNNFFPVFLDMTGRKVLVYGAGKIAARRVEVLLRFGAQIILIAPEIMPEMEEVMEKYRQGEFEKSGGKITAVEKDVYRQGTICEDVDFVLAATDDGEVNERIFRECRHRELLVNVASDKEKCNFHFPAIVETEDVIIGIASGGEHHEKVSETAKKLREMFL